MKISDEEPLDGQWQLSTLPPVPGQHYEPGGGDVELRERPDGTFVATSHQTADEIRLMKDRPLGYEGRYQFYELVLSVTGWLLIKGIPRLLFVAEVPLGMGVASFYIIVMGSVSLVYGILSLSEIWEPVTTSCVAGPTAGFDRQPSQTGVERKPYFFSGVKPLIFQKFDETPLIGVPYNHEASMNKRTIIWLGLLLIAILIPACGPHTPPEPTTDHYDHRIPETTETLLRLSNRLTLIAIIGLGAALICDIGS